MRWSLGFGPFRVYGGKSAASRQAARQRKRRREREAWEQARAEAARERRKRREHEAFEREYYSPERVAEREARKVRTYRATVSGCRIDPLKGGEFTVSADDRPDLHFTVTPDMALGFMSLRNKDVVQVTVTPDGQGVEEFWHLARANGAQPRNPADFPKGFQRGSAAMLSPAA
jgi:hypothetical protein